MKKHVKDLFVRGLMAASGGPVVMAIVLACLYSAGQVETYTVPEMVRGVLTTSLMAFIASAVSVVYDIERLPIMWATLIHAATLFVDYLIVYRINGWVVGSSVPIFTAVFITGYAAVWFIVHRAVSAKVAMVNSRLNG